MTDIPGSLRRVSRDEASWVEVASLEDLGASSKSINRLLFKIVTHLDRIQLVLGSSVSSSNCYILLR